MAENLLILVFRRERLLKNRNLKGFRGFTLAEVLITLVIIGVIAAMTIPTLMNKTNNQELVSRAKKTYSTLAQATQKIIAEEGNPRADIGGWATDNTAIYNLYKKHLSKAVDCNPGQSCFSVSHVGMDGTGAGTDNYNMTGSSRGKLILADGAIVNFHYYHNNCSPGQLSDETSVCAYIHVDVNGAKGPNVWGRDAFRYYISENGFGASGCDYDSTNCPNVKGGQACSCVVLRENAMNY